jgi:flagellar hook-associated protein 3 FlgL
MDKYKAEKQMANAQEANDELKVAENAMIGINDILVNVHEYKVMKAKNDPTNESGRQVLAEEIKSMMGELLKYANSQYGKKYSFGGTNAVSAPFTVDQNTGRLLYNGIDMDSITLGGDGKFYAGGLEVPMDADVFYDLGLGMKMSGPEVNPDTAFKISYSGPEVFGWGVDADGVSNNIYNVLAEIEKNVRTYDLEELEKYDTKLASLTDSFRSNLTNIGSKTNYLDSSIASFELSVDGYTEKIHDLMATKDAEEATNQMMNDYVLKAVLQMGSRVLPLSLMDFLS